MSFLWLTIPATLLLSAALLGLAIWSLLVGDFDDPELPALRLQLDDDHIPEQQPAEASGAVSAQVAPIRGSWADAAAGGQL